MFPPVRNRIPFQLPILPSLKVAGILALLYFVVVLIGDAAIYSRKADTTWTRRIERIFPYPAAVVNDETIPLSQYRREVAALQTKAHKGKLEATQSEIERLVIAKLVNRTLYDQELRRRKIVVTEKEVDDRLEAIYAEIGGKDKLQAYLLENYGEEMALSDFRILIKQVLQEAAIQHNLLTRATVRHILIAVPENAPEDQVELARKKAEIIGKNIPAVGEFGAYAKEFSEDLASREKGGELGTTIRGSERPVFSADFENTIFTIEPGTISGPVRSSSGWHIVLVDKREGELDMSMKQFTEELRAKSRIRQFVP